MYDLQVEFVCWLVEKGDGSLVGHGDCRPCLIFVRDVLWYMHVERSHCAPDIKVQK